MLTDNMTLRQMIDYTPGDEDLAILPLEVTVLCKLTIISPCKEDNYAFIRYFFSHEETKRLFYESEKTSFYDFDAREVKNSHKFLTLTTLYGKDSATLLAGDLRPVLTAFSGEADVILDLYTFGNKCFRLSLLEGVFKAEEVKAA